MESIDEWLLDIILVNERVVAMIVPRHPCHVAVDVWIADQFSVVILIQFMLMAKVGEIVEVVQMDIVLFANERM